MYADPAQIRKHRVTIYLNDCEAEFVRAAVNLNGAQKAAWLRKQLLEGLRAALHGDLDIDGAAVPVEGAQIASIGG